MAGGRFLSGDDPTISPDARIRASVGVGNDCEPYVDPLTGLSYPIAPPGVYLPSCFAVDQTRGQPGVQAVLDRIYAGATPEIRVTAIGELERLAVDRFLAVQRAQMTYNATELAFFREQQRRIDAGLPIITAQDLAPFNVRPAVGPTVAAGGTMSSPFMLGVGVGAPGGTLPLGFGQGFGFIGSSGAQDLLGGLLQGGISLGTQYLQQQLLAKQQEDAFKRQRELLQLQLQLGQQGVGGLNATQQGGGQVVVGPDGTLTMGGAAGGMPAPFGPSWVGFEGGACCPTRGPITVSPMDAPSLYRQGCGPCAPVTPRSRFFALRANGTRDLFVRVGTVNSVSPRTLTKFARRWAKQAKLTVGSRSSSRRRARRRPR